MAPKSNYLIGGLALAAATICVLPAVESVGTSSAAGASTRQGPVIQVPVIHVNRAVKRDRMPTPISVNVKKPPAELEPPPAPEPTEEGRIMDGCEPAFSPVTVPSMAHLASRCIG